MPEEITTELCILGGGAGGLSVAAGAARLGISVILLEPNALGGDCLNYGCVPSKSLLAASKVAHQITTAKKFGLQASLAPIDFKMVMDGVQEVIQTIGEHDSIERFTNLGVHVISAKGQFIDPDTLQVGNVCIKAKKFIIATGSSAAIPPIPGLSGVPYFTNHTIFSLTTKPEHLIILGGGPMGCEMAQAFCHLGCKVTLLERINLLPKDDLELVGFLREQLVKSGVIVRECVNVVQATCDSADKIQLSLDKQGQLEVLTGSHLLVATGRLPNVDNLGLTQAKIKFSPQGIIVNKRCRTSNKKIYALGDVTGMYPFTHMASYQAMVIIKNILFGLPARAKYQIIPWVTYTSPELASAGLLAQDAVRHRIKHQILTWNLSENDRAQTERVTVGKIKVILGSRGKILGVSILAQGAGELLTPWILAMENGLKIHQIATSLIPYPTMSEVSKRVAGSYFEPWLQSDSVKRWIGLLKKLKII